MSSMSTCLLVPDQYFRLSTISVEFLQTRWESGLLAPLGLARPNIIPIIKSRTFVMLRDAIPAVIEPAMLVLPGTIRKNVFQPDPAEAI